jgi:hypothetical protein
MLRAILRAVGRFRFPLKVLEHPPWIWLIQSKWCKIALHPYLKWRDVTRLRLVCRALRELLLLRPQLDVGCDSLTDKLGLVGLLTLVDLRSVRRIAHVSPETLFVQCFPNLREIHCLVAQQYPNADIQHYKLELARLSARNTVRLERFTLQLVIPESSCRVWITDDRCRPNATTVRVVCSKDEIVWQDWSGKWLRGPLQTCGQLREFGIELEKRDVMFFLQLLLH